MWWAANERIDEEVASGKRGRRRPTVVDRNAAHDMVWIRKIRKSFGSYSHKSHLDPKAETFWIERYENLLNRKIRKPFGYKDTFQLSDPKERKPSRSKDTKTFWIQNPKATTCMHGRLPMAAAVRIMVQYCRRRLILPTNISCRAKSNGRWPLIQAIVVF